MAEPWIHTPIEQRNRAGMRAAEAARNARAILAGREVLELAGELAGTEHPESIPAHEGIMWSVRGEPRTRADFGKPHFMDFTGGLPLPPRDR